MGELHISGSRLSLHITSMGNVDACHSVKADDCQRIETCTNVLAKFSKSHACAGGNAKHFVRARPSSEMSDAPLALWSGIRPANGGKKEILDLTSSQSMITKGTEAATSGSVDNGAPSTGVPLLLPIPSKVGIVRQRTRGTPLAHKKAGMTPKNAGMTPANGVKRCIFRKGTRGTPLARLLQTAGMTPMTHDKHASSSFRGDMLGTPSEAVTQAKRMTEFVKTMMKGSQMTAMTPGGSMKDIQVALDNKLSSLMVTRDGQERCIPLEQIDDVSIGQDAEGQLSMRVDDHYVTLLLENSRCLTLHFEDEDQAEAFADCMAKMMAP